MTRLLVTGATGFVGRWTLKHWRSAHPEILLWATGHEPVDLGDLADEFAVLNLCDRPAVAEFVRRCAPTQVIHLAGLVGPGTVANHLSVNAVGTDNLYAALAEIPADSRPRIVQAGTAAVYGPVRPDDLPVSEAAPLQPVTSYALGKTAQEYVASTYGLTGRLDIVRTRLFNLLGPGQPERLVPAAFIKQIKERPDTIRVGNMNTRRDFVDIRDVVRALDGLLQDGRPGRVYNVASGASVAIGDLLQKVIEMAGHPNISIQQDEVVTRKFDVMDITGDTAAIREDIGWCPSISLERSLQDMIEAAT